MISLDLACETQAVDRVDDDSKISVAMFLNFYNSIQKLYNQLGHSGEKAKAKSLSVL